MSKECIAMILAGGSGRRLKPLTRRVAKPAVLFGGKYRIIDFVLSNCINSGIDTMGIMVQYEPLIINSYISTNSLYNPGIQRSYITVLPPHMHEDGGGWYRGTANAVYQNLEFIDLYKPEHVLILSADQVYKMDYSKMLQYHISQNAEITIAATRVPMAEAGRFGIMNVEEDGRILEFEEKPEHPKNDLASMGIYIFRTDILVKALGLDEANPSSKNDFGRDVIPMLINSGNFNVCAFRFNGYWRDVGTVKSFWEAHMDLLDESNSLNLHDPSWKIFCENPSEPPLYINHTAKVNASLLGDGCYIQGEVYNSVLFPGVFVGRGAKIYDSVIMSNATVEAGSTVRKAIVGSNAVVKSLCTVSNEGLSEDEVAYVDEGTIIEACSPKMSYSAM
jgi:glucose-1-phosphate adenylyltransferase